MGTIQILTRTFCCSQPIDELEEVETRPIIEQTSAIVDERLNESFKTIIPS